MFCSQVLPEHVPSPLRAFTWEEIQDIEVPDMIQQLHHASWLLSDAYPRLSAEAMGNASREDLEWAVSVSALSQPFIHFQSVQRPGCCPLTLYLVKAIK